MLLLAHTNKQNENKKQKTNKTKNTKPNQKIKTQKHKTQKTKDIHTLVPPFDPPRVPPNVMRADAIIVKGCSSGMEWNGVRGEGEEDKTT